MILQMKKNEFIQPLNENEAGIVLPLEALRCIEVAISSFQKQLNSTGKIVSFRWYWWRWKRSFTCFSLYTQTRSVIKRRYSYPKLMSRKVFNEFFGYLPCLPYRSGIQQQMLLLLEWWYHCDPCISRKFIQELETKLNINSILRLTEKSIRCPWNLIKLGWEHYRSCSTSQHMFYI